MGPYHRQKRQRLATLRGVQSRRNSCVKPTGENYLRLIQAPFCARPIRWVSHAMHPRASCGKKSARQLTGPDFFEPRIGSTGVDANRWEPP